ncbi:MAG: CvpA family protein [Rickettsiales bacterium TMED254]|nr:hypothetical protein [Rickettsiales bacterium]RPF77047.1 MAG: CvpA family protein [Rickettsiales bacterium TMED254]
MSSINNLNYIDLIIVIFTIISMIYGYSRGFIKETLSILSIFISVYISTLLYPNISFFIKEYINMDIIADSVSFVILFTLIYSSINIITNFIVSKSNKTLLEIFDKNFGIIFGFFRSILIFAFINILLSWTIWKKNVPISVTSSKSMLVIDYTSSKIIEFFPDSLVAKIKKVFGIEIALPELKKNIEKYNEPIIDNSVNKDKKGYSDNDNNSLDKLFNIENNE